MEVRGFLQRRNRLSWHNPSSEVEIDLTLRLGLPDHHERSQANQEAPQGITPQNFNMNIFRYYNQAIENVGMPNARGDESVRLGDIINQRPWSFRTWMQSNNGNMSSSLCQGELRCTICGKTETPLWRRGPEGPRRGRGC